MSYSRITYQGDGSTTVFPIPFDYMNRKHITVQVDTVLTDFAWKSPGEIRLAKAPKVGAQVRVARDTPINAPPADFKEGALITANDLDVIANYYLMVAQEAKDRADEEFVTALPPTELNGGLF